MRAFLCSLLLSGFFALQSSAQTFEILHSFGKSPDGSGPWGTLVRDQAGNLYGTTVGGGASSTGTVFKIGLEKKETILHNFGAVGSGDGNYPYAGLVLDAAGNLYGTTSEGGAYGAGTVFQVNTARQETILYSFGGLAHADGAVPFLGSLIRDAAGNRMAPPRSVAPLALDSRRDVELYSKSIPAEMKPSCTVFPGVATEPLQKEV